MMVGYANLTGNKISVEPLEIVVSDPRYEWEETDEVVEDVSR